MTRTISRFVTPEVALGEPPVRDDHSPFLDSLSHADERGRAERVHPPEKCGSGRHGRQDADGDV
jgi:hypothetical protein